MYVLEVTDLIDPSLICWDVVDANIKSILCESNCDCLASDVASAIFIMAFGNKRDLHSSRGSSDDHMSLTIVFRDSCT